MSKKQHYIHPATDKKRKRFRRRVKNGAFLAGTWDELNGDLRRPAQGPEHLHRAALACGLCRKLIRWPHRMTVEDLLQMDRSEIRGAKYGYSLGYLLQKVPAGVAKAFLVVKTLKPNP